jgi:hypothetical protein
MNRACPYCGVVPEKEYKYGWKCKDCGNKVAYDKRHLFIFGRDILTQKEAATVELFNRCEIFLGATEKDYQEMYVAVAKKFHITKPNPSDVVWNMINSSNLFTRAVNTMVKDNPWIADAGEVGKEHLEFKIGILNEALQIA